MRKVFAIGVFAVLASCQQQVKVPTAQELINNRQLLAEWQAKCGTGEYSHLRAADKANLCSTTNDATISVAEIKAGKADSDFFEANTKRK